MIAWTETSDVKLKFLEIFEIFRPCGNLSYCICEADWQKFHLFQQILRVDTLDTFHMDTFHGNKGDFPVSYYLVIIRYWNIRNTRNPVSCAVTSFKVRNHYIVVNLIVAVHSAEDYCPSSMKH